MTKRAPLDTGSDRTPPQPRIAAPSRAARDLNDRMASIRLGAGLFGLVFIGAFGLWAALAPLAGGAVADGEIQPEGDRRVVQHLEGGVISEILIEEGSVVAAGDPMLRLANLRTKARALSLSGRRAALTLERARLRAEMTMIRGAPLEGLSAIIAWGAPTEARAALRGELDDALGRRFGETFLRQQALFETRAASRRMRKAAIEERIAGLRQRLAGIDGRLDSLIQRIALIDTELAAKRRLAEKQRVAPLRLLEIESARAELIGAREVSVAEIGQIRRQIRESELELQSYLTAIVEENAARLAQIAEELVDLLEEMKADRDVIERGVVRAPISGRVLKLNYKTEGGVVAPGGRILEIVPLNEKLIVKARLSVLDVDVIAAGQPVRIRLSAFPSRTTPEVEGRVLSISPDRLYDEKQGRFHYEVRVQAQAASLAKLDPDMQIVPGMPAEVLFVSETRTLLDYLLEPIMTALRRGLRET